MNIRFGCWRNTHTSLIWLGRSRWCATNSDVVQSKFLHLHLSLSAFPLYQKTRDAETNKERCSTYISGKMQPSLPLPPTGEEIHEDYGDGTTVTPHQTISIDGRAIALG